MGLLDDVLGRGASGVPGGNYSKPLMIALMALLAARYAGGGKTSTSAPEVTPTSTGDESSISPGTVLGGLGGLLTHFQQGGLGDLVNSWIGGQSNKPVSPGQLSQALGPDMINVLSEKTGLPKDQILQILSQILPQAVDKLTPQGRLPTHEEVAEAQ